MPITISVQRAKHQIQNLENRRAAEGRNLGGLDAAFSSPTKRIADYIYGLEAWVLAGVVAIDQNSAPNPYAAELLPWLKNAIVRTNFQQL